MRILQVVNVRWFNATAWYGVELARLGLEAGHQSSVVGLAGTEPLVRAQHLGIPCKTLPLNTRSPLALAALYGEMRNLVQTFRPDVVNCHRGEAFVLWGLLKHSLSRSHPFALVRTRGDQRLPKANLPNRILHRSIADAVIATNSRMAEHLRQMLHIPASRLHIIYGGVDTARFSFSGSAREAVRAQLGYRPDDIVLGLLGRFDAVKGQKECIEAVARLVGQGLPVRLLLLGFTTATTEQQVQQWIDQCGMHEHVRITGKVDDVPGYLSALDLGVVASLWSETIARAALEIMACDRALVSTDTGVMPDLLPDEALCPAGDLDALTRLLARGVHDAGFRDRLRACNRARLPALTSEAFWKETNAVYQDCLSRL